MQPTLRQNALWLALALGALCAPPAAAEPLGGSETPMDLGNREPRWVAVRFEVSPADRPGQIRGHFTPRFLARLEPAERDGEVRIVIDGAVAEEHLFPGQQPSPGSFSDFVWTFDTATGHVVSAKLSGVLLREIGWGFARWKTDAAFDVAMDTFAPVGFETSRMMGEAYPRLCEAPESERCTVVAPHRYDPTTGYVNAVGRVIARSAGLSVQSFSPIGEAVFSEITDPFDTIWTQGGPSLRADVAAPPPR